MPRRGKPSTKKSDSPRGKRAGKGKSARGKRSQSKPASGKMRLNRVLAAAGFGSRRQCEELITEGRVAINGEIVTKLGTTVDSNQDEIRVDDSVLKRQRLVYYAVNKPVGVVTTNRDPQGRPRVIDLVPPSERVFAVGRLDRSSEGLILLTNDGELAQQLAHPKFGVRKVYRVTVAGKVDGEVMKQMRQGIYIAEGHVRVEGARILKSRARATELEIILREGKNREIRRILARLGHKVQHLRRIAVGPLRLGDMPPGAHRVLTNTEIRKLRDSVTEESVASENEKPSRQGTKKVTRKTTKGTTTTRPSKRKNSKRSKAKQPDFQRVPSFEFAEGSARVGSVIGGDVDATEQEERPSRARKTGKRSPQRKVAGKSSASGKPRGSKKKKSKRSKSNPRKSEARSSRRGSARSAKKKSASRPKSKRPGKRKRS